MIRCKFSVQSITDHGYVCDGRPQKTVALVAVCDSTIPDDQAFTKYTPNGRLEVTINNPAALAELQIGSAFYLDLTPCEQRPTA